MPSALDGPSYHLERIVHFVGSRVPPVCYRESKVGVTGFSTCDGKQMISLIKDIS